MSSAIARIEKGPLVPGTPSDPTELRNELIAVSTKLDVERILSAYRVALDFIGTLKEKSSKYYLVNYVRNDHKVYVSGYSSRASQQANLAYTRLESGKKPGDNIVLVSVSSLKALKRAYPNYFLDTEQFAKILSQVLRPSADAVAKELAS